MLITTCSKEMNLFVYFYRNHAFLQSGLQEFIELALIQNDPVIVISRRQNLKELKQNLSQRVDDLEELLENKKVQLFEAEEILNFILNGRDLDKDNFQLIINSALSSARKQGPRVKIYGELVQLLYEQGLAEKALELEEFWNQLLKEENEVIFMRGHCLGTPEVRRNKDRIKHLSKLGSIEEAAIDKKTLIEKLGKLEIKRKLENFAAPKDSSKDKINELQTQLTHSLKLHHLGEIVAGVSHEIVNPVTIITGKIMVLESLLGNEEYETEALLKNLKSIREANERIESIIKNVLIASRKDTSRVEVCEFKEVLHCVLEILNPQFKQHSIKIEKIALKEISVGIGKSELIQVLLNLLINAKDSIKDHRSYGSGQIAIIVSSINEGLIKVTIQDNGKGIAPEHQDKVFLPFFTTKKVGEGTGLGLSISRQIIEKQKGEIYFTTVPGEGASFHVVIPLKA